MKRSVSVSVLCAVVAASMAVGVNGYEPQNERIVLARGADRLPSRTASDWVTYADHVVVVTAVAERALPPAQQDIAHGEGVILRNVTLKVDDVLWSRRTAVRSAPRSFDWTAYGWTFSDGSTSNRTEMAGAGQPRMEKGHRYILAIEWQRARCTPGDFLPAEWRGLGDGSALPFDEGLIGNGEMEGRHQTVARARATADPDDPNYGLEDRMAGRGAETLASVLLKATPHQRKKFEPPKPKTSCS